MIMLRVQECVRGVLLVVICISYTTGCNSVDDQIKFIGSAPMTVQRGRSFVIAASTYNIIYNTSKYDCLVYVTSTATFSCGTISPDVFNCDSRPDLLYTHYGCERNTESIDLAFSLTSSDHNVFMTEHFTIEVTVMSITDSILKPSDKIIVPPDTHKALVSLKLSDHLDCEYAIVSPIELPYYGIVTGPVKQWLPCNSSQSLEYSLNQHPQNQPEDRIIVAIRTNGSISYEQIPVIISGSNDGRMTSCVLEGVVLATFNCYTSVGVENLIAPNCSFPRDWRLHITKGRFSFISLLTSFSPFLATSTFTFGQLQDGMVAYQRKSSSRIQESHRYQYSVYDVYGRVIFNSSVVTESTALAGQHVQIITNTGIDVVEGQSAMVTIKVLDFIHHGCTNFTLYLVEAPRYGHFRSTRTNATLDNVTLHDLHETNVEFEHSGADNFGDRAIWEVQCSNSSIGQFVQPIRVIVKDDSPPYLRESSVLSVHSNSVLQLSQFHLQASDVDSCDTTLEYSITSASGRFYRSKEDALTDNGAGLIQFTQQDIDDGNIWYRPPGDISVPQNDIVLFNVSDDSTPPNVLPHQKLTINIVISYECAFCETVLDPERLSDIPVVEMAGETNLSAIHFSLFTEQFVSHGWLEFHIVDPPHFGDIIPNNFTLDSLRDNQVVYRHKGINHECNDSFVFQMRNTTGAKAFGRMVVSVVKQNTTRTVTLEVNPLEFSVIRPTFAAESIVITDAPVCIEHILFIIESLPEFGKLYCNISDSQLVIGSWFSLRHLKEGSLTYHTEVSSNQANNIYNDSFSFSLHSPLGNLTTNGQHLTYYTITYNLSDPMVTLSSPTTLDRCSESEYLCYYNLTISNINVISNIANDSELRIVIKNGPSCGRLILNNTEVSEFTVSQLKKELIAYEFNATLCNNGNFTDNFGFIIEIAGHTASPVKNYLHLYWSYVMVDQPKIEINETDKTFNITVRRSGYLNQTSKVFCTKGSVSASLCNTCNQLKQVIFIPGQTVAYCSSFTIENNNIAEGISVKKYYVSLTNPEKAIITNGNVSNVYISDLEDYPVIQFTGASPSVGRSSCTHQMTVKEGENVVASAMIERVGDNSREVSVMCTTHPVSARSSQDYQVRDKKRVTFAPGQTIAFCNVTILNDYEYEPQESFQLKLDRPRMLAVTNSSANTLCVFIEEDENDRPLVFFSKTHIVARERKTNYSYHIPISLSRRTDISETEVFYRTRLLPNDTANEKDFQGYPVKSVEFKSVQTIAHGELLIFSDDLIESNETLHVELIPHSHYQLGYPSMITVIILDSYKVVSFTTARIAINETDGPVYLYLNRTGSLDFTFYMSSQFTIDPPESLFFYLPRNITFPANASRVTATGWITDNKEYMGPQVFHYCMATPQNKNEEHETRFIQQCIDITVYDEEDYPTVKFEHANYTLYVPDYQEECSVLAVSVVRNNDISKISSSVQYFTIDDSAVAGKQYYESKGVFHFSAGQERKTIFVQICSHDVPTNHTKKFHLHIVKNDNSTRITAPFVTEVVILGREPAAPFFRQEPVVVSSEVLASPGELHYDTAGWKFLICVTPCDPLLSTDYDASFCKEHGIDNNLTIYEWEISYNNGPFTLVTYSTFFASPRTQILDAFYLLPRSRVRCKATAVDVTGVAGYKRPSQALEVAEEDQLHCSNHTVRVTVELQPSPLFTGQPQDSIKLYGSVSAAGNAVPLLYSRHPALSALTYYPARSSNCVLLAGQAGHLKGPGISRVVVTDCGWEFEVWMSLQELEEGCRAQVTYGNEHTSVHLELELLYFHGNVSSGIELEQYRSQLNVSGTVDHELPPDMENVKYSQDDAGFIKLLDVSLEDIPIVKFQSFANFSGQFLADASNVSLSVSGGLSSQNISLSLEETGQCVHQCTQLWTFQSTDVLHGGPYNIKLIPCVLPGRFTWSPSVLAYCVPMAPITFQLHIPTNENVLPHFNTPEIELLLLKRAENGSHHTEWRFGLDDTVYGGILVDTEEQQRVTVAVQKIIACSTTGGYIPQYNDKASLSGCLTQTCFITKLHSILNVNTMHNTDDGFDAKVIHDIENVQIGWSFIAAPLFDVQLTTQQWFIHVVYNETHNNVVIIKHDIRLIHLVTPSSSTSDVSTSLEWCKTVVTVTIVLSIVVIALLVLSLICWKWNKMKEGCTSIFGDCYSSKSEISTLSKIRRSHRYRAEIQELPHAFPSPNAIHVDAEQCTKNNTPPATGSSTNKRLTGSKKYIVETTM